MSVRQLGRRADAHKDAVWALAWSDDGATLLSGSVDGSLKAWLVENEELKGNPQSVSSAFPLGVLSVVPVSGKPAVVASSMDGCIRVVGTKDGAVQSTIRAGPVDCWTLCGKVNLHDGGFEVASGTHTGDVNFWNTETGVLTKTLKTGGTFVLSIARCANLLAVGHKDGAVRLFDLSTAGDDGVPAAPILLNGHAMPVRGLAFSPDGTRLYTACDDGASLCFSTAGGERVGAFRGHLSWVLGVAATAKHVVTVSADHTVRVWDVETRECLSTFTTHGNLVFSVAFNRTGNMLATGGGAGDIQLYAVPSEA